MGEGPGPGPGGVDRTARLAGSGPFGVFPGVKGYKGAALDKFTIVLGNKNYSSWSLRPWLALKRTGAPFEEIVIPLDQPETKEAILAHSGAGRVPVLHHGERTIWESLAICEYLAELFPDAGLWPADQEARAAARAVSCEMHAGFVSLRGHMPMNIRESLPGGGMTAEVEADIGRIQFIWESCRENFGGGGDFLFGGFTIADAMFAPVVMRLRTYAVDLSTTCRTYSDAVWNLPEMQEWVSAAREEPFDIPDYHIQL